MVEITVFNPHQRVEVGAPEKTYVHIFTIKYLCQMTVLKKRGWYNCLFSHIIGRTVYFGSGTLIWVLRARQDMTKF